MLKCYCILWTNLGIDLTEETFSLLLHKIFVPQISTEDKLFSKVKEIAQDRFIEQNVNRLVEFVFVFL